MRPILFIIILAAAVCFQSGLAAAALGDDRSRPNVLVILADDMGFSDAGCYGGEIETPNLDRLAAGGLRFTQFYNTGRCWPTRAALLTGFYAQQVRRDAIPGVAGTGGRGVRPEWAPLLPGLLRPLGYRSYHSGKWHVDGVPLENGFDRSYRLDDHNRHFSPRNHFEDDEKLPAVEPDSGYYSTTAIADHAVRVLREHANEHAGTPFFYFLAFTAPHFPLHAPSEDIDRYRETYQAGWDAIRQARWERVQELGIVEGSLSEVERDVGPPYDFPKAWEQLGEAEVNRPVPWEDLTDEQRAFQAVKMAVHAAMVDRMDQEIGRVVDQLKAMGAFENTLILFLSDNGASAEIMIRGDGHDPEAPLGGPDSYLCLGPGWSSVSNTPFRRHKTWVHEGGIATPMIAHWPKGIQSRGELCHAPGHVIDIAPTILELAGGEWPGEWKNLPVPPPPGRSIVPVLREDGAGPHEALWWFHDDHRAIRIGDWKLVSEKGGDWELFNLGTDRAETENLAFRYPEKVRQMEREWMSRLDAFRELAADGR